MKIARLIIKNLGCMLQIAAAVQAAGWDLA